MVYHKIEFNRKYLASMNQGNRFDHIRTAPSIDILENGIERLMELPSFLVYELS